MSALLRAVDGLNTILVDQLDRNNEQVRSIPLGGFRIIEIVPGMPTNSGPCQAAELAASWEKDRSVGLSEFEKLSSSLRQIDALCSSQMEEARGIQESKVMLEDLLRRQDVVRHYTAICGYFSAIEEAESIRVQISGMLSRLKNLDIKQELPSQPDFALFVDHYVAWFGGDSPAEAGLDFQSMKNALGSRALAKVNEALEPLFIRGANLLGLHLLKLLTLLGWPQSQALTADSEERKRLFALLKDLLGLTLRMDAARFPSQLGEGITFRTLLKPVEKRFKFHFSPPRVTYSPDKPEWVFVHAIDVIKESSVFLLERIQPLVAWNVVEIWTSLISRLAGEICESFLHDAWRGNGNGTDTDRKANAYFQHGVSEMVVFDQQVLDAAKLPTAGFPPIQYLIFDDVERMERWCSIEYGVAKEHFQVFSQDKAAFALDLDDLSSFRPARIVSSTVRLVRNLQKRHASIREERHREIAAGQIYLKLLDGLYTVLEDVNRSELWFEYVGIGVDNRNDSTAGENSSKSDALQMLTALANGAEVASEACLEWSLGGIVSWGSIFTRECGILATRFRKLAGEIYQYVIDQIVSSLRDNLETKAPPKHAQLLASMIELLPTTAASNSEKLQRQLHLSERFCDPVLRLSDALMVLAAHMQPRGFRTVWSGISLDLDDILLNSVVLKSYWTEHNAAALAEDLSVWSLLYASFTDEPGAHFPRITKASEILRLPDKALIIQYKQWSHQGVQEMGLEMAVAERRTCLSLRRE